MLILPILAAVTASFGWAIGVVLAQSPARALGTFAFTRIQLIAVAVIMGTACTALGYWSAVTWTHWFAFVISIVLGILLGNLAMIECLRRGGPRRTELLLSLKAPIIGTMAYVWFGETPSTYDIIGALIALSGVFMAISCGNTNASKSDKITGSLAIVVALGLAATTFQGIGFLIIKPALLAGTPPLAATAIRLIGAALLISTIALLPTKIFTAHSRLTPALLGRTILPGFIGYGVSSTLLLYAFANFDAAIAAALGSLSPVLILPILWVKDRRRPHFTAIIGAALAVTGTAVILLF